MSMVDRLFVRVTLRSVNMQTYCAECDEVFLVKRHTPDKPIDAATWSREALEAYSHHTLTKHDGRDPGYKIRAADLDLSFGPVELRDDGQQ